ncbi:MAG: ATP-binding protein, partial [Bacteroidetes bacterium]|nr:ATP-binding protein [Bacteroidota bacterium]
LPWFDTPRSKFLMAFENFWNAYCTKRNDIICVICGSAASWMIKKILKNKGGLHNRISEKIRLMQFNLYEVELFLKEKGIQWSKYDIAQLYLTTGGIPYYLDAIRRGESVVQFVNRACFSKDGILEEEYNVLFSSLFDNSHRHYQIVEALFDKKSGLTRKEIIKKTNLPSGGTLTT